MSIIHQRKEVKKTSFVWCHYLTNGQIWAIAAAARKEANQEVSLGTKSEIFSKSFQHQSVRDPTNVSIYLCFQRNLVIIINGSNVCSAVSQKASANALL